MLQLLPSEEDYWQSVSAQLITLIEPLPPTLRQPLVQVLDNSIHRLLTLWPVWLSSLVPLPTSSRDRLALATLCGGWAAAIRDACLDGELTHLAAPMSRLLWRRAWHLFGTLAVDLRLLLALEQRMVSAYRKELAARTVTGYWQPAQLRLLTARWVCDRAAGWHAVQRAHLILAGLRLDHPLALRLTNALDALILARQLGDDVSDLADDIRAGRASWLIRLIAEEIWRAKGKVTPIEGQRIAGRWLLNTTLRQKVVHIHATLCQYVMQVLQPYTGYIPRLIDLVTSERDVGPMIATMNLLVLPH
ncbi:hypothetical protein [Chloroflexus sp. Y-396-1]|uniref:hypothetical protein n=1 Tax=Chloroflexus sp. Y-396-1 TaxID=867845 RepID=UPI00048C59F1|nr:hypothetical protein [Chloroflexus sp. Y-396-1]